MEVDKEFPKTWPYGVLKTLQWASPLALIITVYLGAFIFQGVGFVIFAAWCAFTYSIVTWFCYLFGIQKRVFNAGQAYIFFPLALTDFFLSLLFLLFFGISTLICVICIFEGLKYRFGVFLTYLFASAFSMLSGAVFGYYAILIYRACPNGQLRNLYTVVVEGDRITARDTSGQTTTSTTTPSSNQPGGAAGYV